MAKKPTDDSILSIQLQDKEGDVLAADSTDSTFDDVSPLFTQRVTEKARVEAKAEAVDEDEIDELDHDEEDEDADEPRRRKAKAEDEDPEEEEEVEEQEESEEDADRRSIPKRVARERRLLEESRAEARELRARQDAIEAQLATQADEAKFNTFKSETDTKILALRADRRKAIEEGDTDKQDELDDEISDLKADLKSRERALETAKEQLKTRSTARESSSIALTKVNAWKRKHPKYGTDPAFTATVNGIDNAVAAENFDRESEEYYKELDRRVAKLYPGEYPKLRTRPRRGPSEHRGSGAPAQRAQTKGYSIREGKLHIPKTELSRIQKNMQTFGMDPTNADDVKAYVMNNRS